MGSTFCFIWKSRVFIKKLRDFWSKLLCSENLKKKVSQFLEKLRFLNIFFLKPGLTKKFHFYKGPPILTRWRCLLYARNLQFWLLSSDEFLLRKWFSQKFCKNMLKNMAKPLFDVAAPIFFKIVLKFSGIKQTAPSSENWRSFIKWNFLVRPGLRKKMLRNLSFDINWDLFSVIIGNSQHQKTFPKGCSTSWPNQILM